MTASNIEPRTWSDLTEVAQRAIVRPESASDGLVRSAVRNIFSAVEDDGDIAVRAFSEKFDGRAPESLRIAVPENPDLIDGLDAEDLKAIEMAARNIEAYHKAGMATDMEVKAMPGVTCRRISRPIDTVGLYVPGGSAPLFSTLLMLAIPARLAGVPNIIVSTPPPGSGQLAPATLAAAALSGISEIYLMGGAQAIAAMALGTDEVPRVEKIFGPGNAFVTEAKRYAAALPGGSAIDLPAGPSEVLIIADDSADPVLVAADLLAQAEHDADARAILLTPSENLARQTANEIGVQLADLPRAEIANAALDNSGLFVTSDMAEAVSISNQIAPEHLIINTAAPEELLQDVTCAGSVFLGSWTPESVGDYASGTNHVLPTAGAARAWSGVSVASFQKMISVQTLTRDGILALGPSVERLATLEGLDGHRRAVTYRLERAQAAESKEGRS